MKAPVIKGYRLVHRLPWAGTEEEQKWANLKALDAELTLKAMGIRSQIVGWYDQILIYAHSVDLLANEQAIGQWV